jgi:glycosyltransferase involved in cell wall biosynthesis
MRIAFYTRGSAFNGSSIENKGLGGSESALLYLARVLAGSGHDLSVFCNCDSPGTYNGVQYHNSDALLPAAAANAFDVCVFSRFYEPLAQTKATVRVLWLHDVASIRYYREALPVLDTHISSYFLISTWQMQGFTDTYNIASGKLYLTRNGVDIDLFRDPPPRLRNKLVYINTPFRGLDVLVRLIPAIQSQAPGAEFYLYTGMSLYGEQFSDWEAQLGKLYEHARQMPGVHLREPLPKARLARELMSAWLSVYPSHFLECCSIASLECQAAGTPMITSDLGGLGDTIVNGETGILIPIDNPELKSYSPEYQARFVNHTINLMRDQNAWTRLSRNAKLKAAECYTWQGIAREWELKFRELIDATVQ